MDDIIKGVIQKLGNPLENIEPLLRILGVENNNPLKINVFFLLENNVYRYHG